MPEALRIRRSTKTWWHARALDALTWAIVVVTLSPVAFMVYASLSDYNDVARGALVSADFTPHWSNYREMWIEVDFLSFLRNSIVICGCTTSAPLQSKKNANAGFTCPL